MARNRKNWSRQEVAKEDDPIVANAAKATRQAFEETLQAGMSVLISDDGNLVEVSPDGTRKVIGTVEPRRRVHRKKIQICP